MAVTDDARAGGVQVELTGALALLAQDGPSSELIGVGVAIIVLLVAFGSVVAMGLPIVTALMGIFVGAAGVGVLSAFIDVPEFSLILCAMIGLGVGIDYALFIVTRHRQLPPRGHERRGRRRHRQRHRRAGRAVRRHDRRHRHPRARSSPGSPRSAGWAPRWRSW